MIFPWNSVLILGYLGTQVLSNPVQDWPSLQKANNEHDVTRPLRAIKKSRDFQAQHVGNIFRPRPTLELDYIDRKALHSIEPLRMANGTSYSLLLVR